MLAPILVKGGSGGERGINGSGGSGGSGGCGGSSYSWTTTTHHYYRDANGHKQTRTHYHNHTNVGGSRGPNGPSGLSGNASLHDGSAGPNGSFEFIVEHLTGPVKYLEKFDIQMLDFTFMYPEEDEVIEPGEQGFVTTVTLFNAGLMPSPIHQDLLVSVPETPHIQGLGALEIPRAIAPKKKIDIPLKLEYLMTYPGAVHFGAKPYEVIASLGI